MPDTLTIPATGQPDPAQMGARGARLARLARHGLPVPAAVIYPPEQVAEMAESGAPARWPETLPGQILILRASPIRTEWGGPDSLPLIGVCQATQATLAARLGLATALRLRWQAVVRHGAALAGIPPDMFGPPPDTDASPDCLRAAIASAENLFADETATPYPDTPEAQIAAGLAALARGWNAPSARILRQARGAPEDAGMALIAQVMVLGGLRGQVQFVDERSGAPTLSGHHGIGADQAPLPGPLPPEAQSDLTRLGALATRGGADALRLTFARQDDGALWVLDATPARRSARAAVRIAVDLAEAGVIGRDQALLRVEPGQLVEHLHTQIDPSARRDTFATGISASPGAASGRIVFSAEAAMAAAAQEEACILVRVETSPEDIRGMQAARAVLTMRGGITSHAAVIARGLGRPCVVGASDLRIDTRARLLLTPDGRSLAEGAIITVDGTTGQVLAGAAPMTEPDLSGAFGTLMGWADKVRSISVRANADTADDARLARSFNADGIGLCRTEHMFFDEDRIKVMQELILSDAPDKHAAALARLLPMQRSDFVELFRIMRGLPVTIRLLDPPLHEFLPQDDEGMNDMAAAMGLTADQVRARARDLAEVNPMLGLRGVRLGIMRPEIYDMQARAIFEAVVLANSETGDPVVPEVMIPLVSANREVELVKSRIDRIAQAVRQETGTEFLYKLGVMVETPRAALRAGDLAQSAAFLSFGTNDLTQMTYGLSRDDAGRFMRQYVALGVFPEDPFHTLDLDGVGELMLEAARRGRATNPNLTLALCGEHGGDPVSVQFCKVAGFDYVSCSPYRVPIARLAAAQASILRPEDDSTA